MKNLEDFVKPTQKELYKLLRIKYRSEAVVHMDNYILVPGQAPIMLIAHLDTVHKTPVKCICKSSDGNILMSPQGIGGDDRCGVYALVKVHEAAPIKPWLLFTCDEEIGGLGAETFAMDYSEGKIQKYFRKQPKGLETLKLLVEIDRKGSKDAVYYDCDNPEFEAYITSKGFVKAIGSFSDISIIAPEMGIAAVNLSSGYYNAHTLHEYINRKQIDAVIKAVVKIIADSVRSNFPKFKYVKRIQFNSFYKSSSEDWNTDNIGKFKFEKVPSSLSCDEKRMYKKLLEVYSKDELEWDREEYGNWIIGQMYNAEFGSSYDMADMLENN